MQITAAIVISIIGCVLSIVSFFKNDKKDAAAEERWRGSVEEQLKAINTTLSELKGLLNVQNVKLEDHEKRLIRLESRSDE